MILVDSSIWIDHFRFTNNDLVLMLAQGNVMQHPFVTAEIALGSVKDRSRVIRLLSLLPQADRIADETLLELVGTQKLHGSGLGLVDAHLLGSALSRSHCRLWTRDKRLAAMANELGCGYSG